LKKFLSILSSIVLLCSIVSCQRKANEAKLERFEARTALEEQNRKIAQSFIDAIETGNLEMIEQLCSPEFIHHHRTGRTSPLDQMIKSLKQGLVDFPERTLNIEDLIVEKDKVVVRYVQKGIYEGGIASLPAMPKKIEMNGIVIIRIENGKIAEDWSLPDRLSFFQQLGL
jgi:steroid delta-isomerase-like uncharacterized protein